MRGLPTLWGPPPDLFPAGCHLLSKFRGDALGTIPWAKGLLLRPARPDVSTLPA